MKERYIIIFNNLGGHTSCEVGLRNYKFCSHILMFLYLIGSFEIVSQNGKDEIDLF